MPKNLTHLKPMILIRRLWGIQTKGPNMITILLLASAGLLGMSVYANILEHRIDKLRTLLHDIYTTYGAGMIPDMRKTVLNKLNK
jgi:hypothetical protein